MVVNVPPSSNHVTPAKRINGSQSEAKLFWDLMESSLQRLCGLGGSQSHRPAEFKGTLAQPATPKASKDQFSECPWNPSQPVRLGAKCLSAKPSSQSMSKDQVIDLWLASETQAPLPLECC